jgi:DNA gyrase subunit A
MQQILGSGPDGRIVGATVLHDDVDVLTLSARGLIKRTAVDEYRGRTQQMTAAGVRGDDALVDVTVCRAGDEVVVAHTGGLVIRFTADDVRAMGRPSFGVAAQQVPAGERCVALSVIALGTPDPQIVTLDRAGTGKRSPMDDYPTQKRGGKGVRSGAQDLAWCGAASDLHVVTVNGPEVLRPAQLDAAGRATRPAAVTAALVAPVVAEQPAPGAVR